MTECTIVSDWHIGSEVCQRDKIINFLKNLNTKMLILNGDIIDINHLKRLTKKDWKILGLLRKHSKHIEIIYIRGNHDPEISEVISELLGLSFKKEFDVTINEVKYHITHGDYFDSFISNFSLITEIATTIYYWIQRFDSKKQTFARSIKRSSKLFTKCCNDVMNKAEKYAISKNYDHIVCGHTHRSYYDINKRYINTGCFTEIECNYLEIDTFGIAHLKTI
jgi:UDP-2,3-diacylglucosamine pyrophosphatase LpxH